MLFASAGNADTDPVACDPILWIDLVGQPVEMATEVPDPKRVIPPNTAITRDYRFNRTNLDVDDAGIITKIWCG